MVFCEAKKRQKRFADDEKRREEKERERKEGKAGDASRKAIETKRGAFLL